MSSAGSELLARSHALAISDAATSSLDLDVLMARHLADFALSESVDIVALGKSASECARVAVSILGPRVARSLVVTDDSAPEFSATVFVRGDHPLPSKRSVRAAQRVCEFLDLTSASTTLFLISGGASSLCALPLAPVTLDDVHEVWDRALRVGLNITELNTLRAAVSTISGGAILRRVRTTRSVSLVMVDNVVSGAPWVASGLTYEHRISSDAVAALVARLDLTATALGDRLFRAAEGHDALMSHKPETHHENRVLAEPSLLLAAARDVAHDLGYAVIDGGASVSEPVQDLARRYGDELRNAQPPTCVVAVGEVGITVTGTGRGGRCQEFAVTMIDTLAAFGDAACVARASDGRDFLDGVGGACVDAQSRDHARALHIDTGDVLIRHDTYDALRQIGGLLPGSHTGWNLCDLYIACRRN